MDYIGSKQSLNSWIFSCIAEHLENDPECYVFLDACAGSGAVSRFAAQQGYHVIANDLMHFSKAIVNGSIDSTPQPDLINRLNALDGTLGFFYTHFSEVSGRSYFTLSNAAKLDAIRQFIETVDDPKLHDYLLYCSLEAMSRVLNTTGVQAAYLKEFKPRALQPIWIEPEYVVSGTLLGTYVEDILNLLRGSTFKVDILYVDPPYNHRQYGPNYHLYETFVRNDKPKLIGKTGLRDWQTESDSLFCKANQCENFLGQILAANTAPLVALSYNSDGLLTPEQIKRLFENEDMTISCREITYRRFKSDSSSKRRYNLDALHEYLFIAEK